MSDPHKPTTQQSLRIDAARFFDWCPFNLRLCVKELDEAAKREFEIGELPRELLEKVRSAWATYLKTSLPWDEQFAAIRRALPDSRDYDAWMNCSMHLLPKLPRRIRTAVGKEQRKRAIEIHEVFFANEGDERIARYLRIWQSRDQALERLIAQAWGYRRKAGGGASVGNTEVDIERMMLSEAEATGSAMKVGRLLPFIRSLWEDDETVFIRTGAPKTGNWNAGLERKVIPNPNKSEDRLNRFLIKLGRALARSDKRRELPDWLHGVHQTERYIVEGWCRSIIVDGERWPPLCFLTTQALVRFLRLCNVKHCRLAQNKDARSIEKAIQRLGLLRIPRGRIRHVEKRGGHFYFT